jgi:hypothetical protein
VTNGNQRYGSFMTNNPSPLAVLMYPIMYSTIEKKILVGYKQVSKLHQDFVLIYHIKIISETEMAISLDNGSA